MNPFGKKTALADSLKRLFDLRDSDTNKSQMMQKLRKQQELQELQEQQLRDKWKKFDLPKAERVVKDYLKELNKYNCEMCSGRAPPLNAPPDWECPAKKTGNMKDCFLYKDMEENLWRLEPPHGEEGEEIHNFIPNVELHRTPPPLAPLAKLGSQNWLAAKSANVGNVPAEWDLHLPKQEKIQLTRGKPPTERQMKWDKYIKNYFQRENIKKTQEKKREKKKNKKKKKNKQKKKKKKPKRL